MTKNTIYAYVIGNDFNDIADQLIEQFDGFIAHRDWICPSIWTVNQQWVADDGHTEWDLGLNIDLPDPYHEPLYWFNDVKSVASFLTTMRQKLKHDFVIGISDNEKGISEDIIEVDSDNPDIDYLERFIGVEPPKK
jgi:hypothetical protein